MRYLRIEILEDQCKYDHNAIQLNDAMHWKVLLTSSLEAAILIFKEVTARAHRLQKTGFHQADKPLQQLYVALLPCTT